MNAGSEQKLIPSPKQLEEYLTRPLHKRLWYSVTFVLGRKEEATNDGDKQLIET